MTSRSPDPARVLVCSCQKTMSIDPASLGAALDGTAGLTLHTELCRSDLPAFETALAAGERMVVACTQEAPLFLEVAAEREAQTPPIAFANIRETAGWSRAGGAALPKMAALLAEASYEAVPAGTVTLESKGQCLVYGAGQQALDVANSLAERLSVTVVLADAADALPPAVVRTPIYSGRIRGVRGALGAFEVSVDGYAPVLPSSRSRFDFAMARDGAKTRCDLILDISGLPALVSGHGRRDGYISADPKNPAAVAKAMFEIVDLVGTFEKPRYVAFEPALCAHSRSAKVGCRNCLDACPLGAISPSGDHVAVDAAICGGCGTCASVCPTGAVSYTLPRRADVIGRIAVLLNAYKAARGQRPVLLAHDDTHGRDLIAAIARHGRGLPANVIPLKLNSTLALSHETLGAALALGAERVVVLAPPQRPDELAGILAQAGLVSAISGGLGYGDDRVMVLAEADPDVVEHVLHDLSPLPVLTAHTLGPSSGKRETGRTVFAKLHETSPAPVDLLQLPAGAPFGQVTVDTTGCTLCLACVGACPMNALSDNPDRPELSFTEAACVQCGICVATCPEKVMRLDPRYDFTTAALAPRVLKTEDPFNCIRCSKPFGTKSSVEMIVGKLRGHSMFKGEGQIAILQMCDTCRIETLANSSNDPFSGGPRPKMHTTDDDLAQAAAQRAAPRKPEDFLG
ncbi:MAG: 4Fe-4S dicluster domain-containing protein [Hyphomicrobiaceae bacterium]|nr:4Fe-4S dicluster domain-containing protein [Hyphomicrobiaceae bacterium]